MKSLKHLYRIFMWQKLHPKLDFEFNDVLVAGFVRHYYIVVLKNKFKELEYTLIVDNIKNPIQIVLNASFNPGRYHIFNISAIKRLPVKLYKALNKRGLFMTDKDRSGYDGWTSIHRLIYAIYDNCKGLTIHHIDKDKENNSLGNLVPVPQEENNEIEHLFTLGENQKAKSVGRNLWIEQEEKIKENTENKKLYKPDNDRIQMDIVRSGESHSTSELIKKFKLFIKTPQKIRDISNYFFYKSDFLKWLDNYSSRLYSRKDIEEMLT